MKTTKTIYFDLDGTIVDLYGVPNWLEALRSYSPIPYIEALPLLRLSALAKRLNNLQANGFKIGIVSWLSAESTPEYDIEVTNAKLEWLATHLPSVEWDEIHIIKYGVSKRTVVENPFGILFDDSAAVREDWWGMSFNVDNILEILELLSKW